MLHTIGNYTLFSLQLGKPHEFQYSDLSNITQNFDGRPLSGQGRLIGKGGFGEVFLGKLNFQLKGYVLL